MAETKRQVIVEINKVPYKITTALPESVQQLKHKLTEALIAEQVFGQNERIATLECFSNNMYQGCTASLWRTLLQSSEILLRVSIEEINNLDILSATAKETVTQDTARLQSDPELLADTLSNVNIKEASRNENSSKTSDDLVQGQLKMIMKSSAPSSFGIFWADKEQEALQYKCHRPSKFFGPHVSLFHPVFNMFKQIFLQGESNLTEEDSQFTLKLCHSMSVAFNNENSRNREFCDLLQDYLGVAVVPFTMDRPSKRQVTCDAAVTVDVEGKPMKGLALSVETKPEIGQGKCCAYMEAVAYHAIFVSTQQNLLKVSCCPSLMCLLTGPFFQVHGTVFTDNLCCDPLTPALPLFVLPNDRHMMTQIACCFAALKKSVQVLQSYYKAGASDRQRGFPFWNQLKNYTWFSNNQPESDNNNVVLEWTYMNHLHPHKQLWLAKTATNQLVVVKWVERKDEQTEQQRKHMLNVLSENQITPKFIGSCTVAHWTVIVHEFVDGIPADSVLKNQSRIAQQVLKNCEQLCQKMHDLGYVHGDLREVNVLANSTTGRVWFIDLDHAGKCNEAKYPLFLNPDIKWPEGAQAGALIECQHDNYWISQLHASLS